MTEYVCKCDNRCLFQKDTDSVLMCESSDKCEHAEKQVIVDPLTTEEVQDWKRMVYSPQTAAAFYGDSVVKELIATIEAKDKVIQRMKELRAEACQKCLDTAFEDLEEARNG